MEPQKILIRFKQAEKVYSTVERGLLVLIIRTVQHQRRGAIVGWSTPDQVLGISRMSRQNRQI